MIVAPVRTHKITQKDTDLFKILDKYLPSLQEKSVVAVTSKIVAICEGRIVSVQNTNPAFTKSSGEAKKDELIKKESQLYLPRQKNKYNVSLTIANNILAASAGIDESNANGFYVLWPQNPQKSAEDVRKYLQKKFNLKNLGVIITDSRTTPLRWGVTAISIGFSGFLPLKDYIGTPDLFGRTFMFEKMSIVDNLASAASLVMGEGAEQTPIAVCCEIPNIEFIDKAFSKKELEDLQISIDDDLYGEFLKNADWEKGLK
ncbi:MAG TPA: coenzyme F420-0:L-glutamate ligase [Candidatus Saccharimonadales bacterium]|nr:coenzyme F420-0:L-glutamate ligase [Candidatus Saccharimonadales bacterium]